MTDNPKIMTMEVENGEEYVAAIHSIVLAAKVISQWDLEKLLHDQHRGIHFGCFTDPTLWREKKGALEEDIELVKAALPLFRLAREIDRRGG